MKKKHVLKFTGFALFVALAYYATRHGALSNLSEKGIQNAINSFGMASPVAYVIFYAMGVCLLLPATLLTAGGAVIFGTLWGATLTIIGATLGAIGAFLIARILGKNFVEEVLENHLEKIKHYDEKIEENGFATIFYLRMIYMPYSALSFASGLTRVSFQEFFWATFLTVIPGSFVFTYFFDSITRISSLSDILQTEVLLPVGLFLIMLFVPIIVKKHKEKLLD